MVTAYCTYRHINATRIQVKLAWMLLVDSFLSPRCVQESPELSAAAALLVAAKLYCDQHPQQSGDPPAWQGTERSLLELGLDPVSLAQACGWIAHCVHDQSG